MGFFDPPPPRPEPPEQEPRLPPWHGAPEGAIGAPVEATLLIAKTDRVAVGVTDLLAFPTGFSLRVVAFSRRSRGPGLRPEDVDPYWGESRRRREAGEEALPDELLRFGVQFADGAKATSMGADAALSARGGRPSGPVLSPHQGGGGRHAYSQEYWVWPLPPPGPLAFVCEWPAYGVGLSRVEVEAERVRAAAAGALAIWPEDEPFAEIEET